MSEETSAASLARLFKGPDAHLGTKWMDSVEGGWTEESLHHKVLVTGTLTAAKTKEMYGHFRTKTQMRGVLGPHWTENPIDETKAEIRRLNNGQPEMTHRLQQLRTNKIGGILVVTKVLDGTGHGNPFLTILAAPSVTTYNETTGDVGVILADIWEESVLEDFHPDLDQTTVHCPVIGA